MITIRLIDARRELSLKCRELFTNERIAKEVYGYLCDGLEECDEVERKMEMLRVWQNYVVFTTTWCETERLQLLPELWSKNGR